MKEPSATKTRPGPWSSFGWRDENNFNFLRLLLASLVVVGHGPELLDGDRHREPLTLITGQLSLGEFAVDCFFLISGYLVCRSWLRQPNLRAFITKRVLRVLPGFFVASLVSALIVAPFSTDALQYFQNFNPWICLFRATFFLSPLVPSVFPELPYPILNGSLWTITYEVMCYAILALLGWIGILKRTSILGVLSALSILTWIGITLSAFPSPILDFLSHLNPHLIHLGAFFAFGSSIFVFQSYLRYNWIGFTLATTGLVLLTVSGSGEIGLLLCGSYSLFSIAFADLPLLRPFRKMPDISYGIYLYSWPIQNLLILKHREFVQSPGQLLIFSLALSAAAGYLSCILIERPFLRQHNGSLPN